MKETELLKLERFDYIWCINGGEESLLGSLSEPNGILQYEFINRPYTILPKKFFSKFHIHPTTASCMITDDILVTVGLSYVHLLSLLLDSSDLEMDSYMEHKCKTEFRITKFGHTLTNIGFWRS